MDIYSSKLSPAVDYGAGAFLLLIALLSIVGNLLVLVMAYKRSSHMKPPELLSVNLAVADLGAAASMYPLAVASSWSHAWLGGRVTCVYYGLMGFFFGVASMATLTLMAVVRFSVFSTVPSSKRKLSKRRVQALLAATWLYALLWAVLPLLGWGRYGPEPFGLSCTLAWTDMKESDNSFIISIFSMNLVIPAIIITSCYIGIVLRLYVSYKSMKNCNVIPSTVKTQRRLVVIAILVSFGFIGCWTPYGILSLLSIYSPNVSIPAHVSMLPCLFAKTSTVYNPFIYYMFSSTFKQEVKELVCVGARVCISQPNKGSENAPQVAMCDRNKAKKDDLSEQRSNEQSNDIGTQVTPMPDP
ncbi:opsin 8, group member b [Brachyhypopomus gauderio]|uniref:opsin 8, group member b n=1 Tax=Brachyhypopomus gauderio TaxID=698409 RepID=UPI0040423B88